MTISVVIITKDRPKLLAECVSSFLQQSILPSQFVIVEDISDSSSPVALENIKNKIVQKEIQYDHIQVRFSNYSASRNKALSLAHGALIISCDDDILVSPDTIAKIISFHQQYPEALSMCPMLSTIEVGLWAEYDCYSTNDYRRLLKQPTKIYFAPTAFFTLTQNVVAKKKIKFDDSLYIGEDHDFFQKLKENSYIVIFNPSLTVFHHFRHTFWTFLKHHIQYAHAISILEERSLYFSRSSENWLPKRKMHLLFFPIFILNQIHSYTINNLKRLHLGMKYYLPALVTTLTLVYTSFKKIKSVQKNVKFDQ